jgi:hypothetical protein
VTRIGQQCERIGGEPADDLGDHVCRSEYEGHREPPAIPDGI